jgi:hypothetical protein
MVGGVTAFEPCAFQHDAFQIVPCPPPPPVFPPVLNVNIDGGWSNLGQRVEIVDGPSPAEVEAYLDELWEDKEKEYEQIEPDFVLGKEEYEREKSSRKRRPPPSYPPPPTTWSYDLKIDEVSKKRASLLVADASLHDFPIIQADVFPLRYRLRLFSRQYEDKMRGGSMVRLVPSDSAMILPLARLARLHRYRLVLWTPNAIYLFDKTTLRAKVSGAVWMAVGAGFALWLGRDLWGRSDLSEVVKTKK